MKDNELATELRRLIDLRGTMQAVQSKINVSEEIADLMLEHSTQIIAALDHPETPPSAFSSEHIRCPGCGTPISAEGRERGWCHYCPQERLDRMAPGEQSRACTSEPKP